MIGTIVYQLTKNLTESEIKEAGFDSYFVDHTAGIYPQAASGTPYSAASIQVKGDPIADLHEDLAADEQATIDYLMCVVCQNRSNKMTKADVIEIENISLEFFD